jgi:hypothetical protein
MQAQKWDFLTVLPFAQKYHHGVIQNAQKTQNGKNVTE